MFLSERRSGPLAPSILYVRTEYCGVLRSTDRREHWTAVNDDLVGMRVQSLAIDPVDTHHPAGDRD